MRLENAMKTANKVLSAVKKKLVGVKGFSGTIYPYKNGRENGYAILIHDTGDYYPNPSRRVFFSENRKSDDIVVYTEDRQDKVYQDTLTDESYENAKYFGPNQVKTAAAYIVKFLTTRSKAARPSNKHIEDCELGDNWLDCPACVEHHNATCAVSEKV